MTMYGVVVSTTVTIFITNQTSEMGLCVD